MLFHSTGLAYILKLLDQYSHFDALHWFQSVQRKYAADIAQQKGTLPERRNRSSKKTAEDLEEEEKLMQTKTLALKRIEIYRKVCHLPACCNEPFLYGR